MQTPLLTGATTEISFLTHWRRQLWDTSARAPRLLTIFKSLLSHTVYNSQLNLVPYSLSLSKCVKSATSGVLSCLEMVNDCFRFFFTRAPPQTPLGSLRVMTLPLTPLSAREGIPSPPVLHPINVSVSAPRFVPPSSPSHQILATPLHYNENNCGLYVTHTWHIYKMSFNLHTCILDTSSH